ncbi:MAG: PorV/PorQ family protein [Hyphomicrobiales bacterium]
MRTVRPFVALCAVLALAAGARQAAAAAGETGFASLKLGVGARAMGMASAYVALADDPTATYWNPAGLASMQGAQVTVMHNEWIQDFRQEYAAVGAPFGPGAVGFAFSGFYTSELEARDATGVLTGHFGFNDVSMTGAYAGRVAPGLDVGAAARYLREMIDQEDAKTFIFDLGAKYRVRDTGVTFGGALQNLGGDPTLVTEKIPLPRMARLGAAYQRAIPRLHGTATLSTEYRKARAEGGRFHVGGEFDYKEQVALRLGAKFGYDAQDVAFGIGLTRSRIRFDYALVPLSSNLGTTHFFSLTARL